MIRPGRTVKFLLERWIQRGILHQLLFVAALIVAIAVAGGVLGWMFSKNFETVFDAIWWSFLRLTDPGYLGDDEGAALRVVSTVVTVLGYVLFMGSLIAIMTQWLARTIGRLEAGLTPISMRGHAAILGWTNRTPEVVSKMMGARGRLTRFLASQEMRRLRVVVQSERVDAERRQELRKHLGAHWDESAIFLRSGSSLHPEQLEGLDLARASVIIVPGADYEMGGSEMTDARAVKTLLSLRRILEPVPLEERPVVVAEIFDPARVPIARSALKGRLEVVASDAVVGRLVSQNVRDPRSTEVFFQLLSHREGNSLYVRAHPELAGEHPVGLNARFPRALVIGASRMGPAGRVAHLDPPPDFRLQADDLLIFVAEKFSACVPEAAGAAAPVAGVSAGPARAAGPSSSTRRVLILGWSMKVASILEELGSSPDHDFEVLLMSRIHLEERERQLGKHAQGTERVRLQHQVEDYTVLESLEAVDPASFDNIVFVASAAMETNEQADARTVLGYVLLCSLLAGVAQPPHVLVELLDPENSELFPDAADAMLVSPRILSHLLAHVALRPELNSVFEALFATGGAEVTIRPGRVYGLAGRRVRFDSIEQAALARGEVALGVVRAATAPGGELLLNPGADWEAEFAPEDEVVVLATESGAGGGP